MKKNWICLSFLRHQLRKCHYFVQPRYSTLRQLNPPSTKPAALHLSSKLIIYFPQFLRLFCLPVARITLSSSVWKVKWMPLISSRGDDFITACVVFMMVIPPLLPNTCALFNHFSKLIPIDFSSSFFFFIFIFLNPRICTCQPLRILVRCLLGR